MSKSKKVWVADDDESIRFVLEKGLIDAGFDVSVFGDDLSPFERIGSLLAYIITGAIVYYVFLRLFGVRLSTFKI